jgi:hypothetical protein
VATFKIAAVQATPVFLHRDATLVEALDGSREEWSRQPL